MGLVTTFRATPDSIEPTSIQASTLDEATLQIPDGAYSVVPVFEGLKTVRLDRHLKRMDDTLRLMNVPSVFSDAQLRHLIRECVRRDTARTARVRLTLPQTEPGVAYVSVEAWQPHGEAAYAQGVRVVTADLQRDVPRAKTTHFVKPRSALYREFPDSIDEAILCSPDGRLLEGAGSNFYAVLDGTIHTAEDAVLIGVARSMLLDACETAPALRLVHAPVRRDDLPRIGEAMLSSASRGIVAVAEIDGLRVGDGKPGRLFAELRRRYVDIFERELASI